MLTIRPFHTHELALVLPLLLRFDPSTSESTWRKLLGYEWENPAGYEGMLMENDGAVVGFMSYVIVGRKLNDRSYTFCNLSSWVVEPEFRSKSLQLLSNVFKLPNVVVTNLSPHENTLSIFNALRFETLSEYEYRINPFKVRFAGASGNTKQTVSFRELTAAKITDPELQKLIQDHEKYDNVHFYEFGFPSKQSLILAFNQKRTAVPGFRNKLRQLPYTILGRTLQFELLYCSDVRLLADNFEQTIKELTKRTDYRSLNISEHFLHNTRPDLTFMQKNKKHSNWYYYSDVPVEKESIDLLYSEKVLLNF